VRAAVDGDDGLGRAEDAGDLGLKVIQGITVLGEDDELAQALGLRVLHTLVVLEDLGEFLPLPVYARGNDGGGLRL